MTAENTFPKSATPRKGDHILVTVPNHWGRGATLAEAKRNCSKASGRPIGNRWRVYSCHPETFLDEMGYIRTPKGAEPLLLISENDPS